MWKIKIIKNVHSTSQKASLMNRREAGTKDMECV